MDFPFSRVERSTILRPESGVADGVVQSFDASNSAKSLLVNALWGAIVGLRGLKRQSVLLLVENKYHRLQLGSISFPVILCASRKGKIN